MAYFQQQLDTYIKDMHLISVGYLRLMFVEYTQMSTKNMNYFLGVDNLKFFKKQKKYISGYFFSCHINFCFTTFFNLLTLFLLRFIFFFLCLCSHITSLLFCWSYNFFPVGGLEPELFQCLGCCCCSQALPLYHGCILVTLFIWNSYLKHHISNSLLKLRYFTKIMSPKILK